MDVSIPASPSPDRPTRRETASGKMRRRARARGFSLIEILVVAAIIAVLATLAFPSYRAIERRTQLTQCASRMRQISMGLFSYAADHDNTLPSAMTDAPPLHEHDEQQSWGYAIWPYLYGTYAQFVYPANCLQMGIPRYPLLRDNVFHCPATRASPVNVPGTTLNTPLYSYGLNSTPLGTTASVTRFLPIRLASIAKPSLTAMIVESSLAYGDYHAFWIDSGMIPHNGGTNVLYFDGHVEWQALGSISTTNTATLWGGN